MIRGQVRAVPVVAIAPQACAGWPGEEERCAVEIHVIGNLRRAPEGIFKRDVEAVDEDEYVLRERPSLLHLVASQMHQLPVIRELDLTNRQARHLRGVVDLSAL